MRTIFQKNRSLNILILLLHISFVTETFGATVSYTDLESSPAGAFVSIYGVGFGADKGSIRFGDVSAEILCWSDSKIIFRRPDTVEDALLLETIDQKEVASFKFKMHSGSIYYVSETKGDDHNDGLFPNKLENDSGPWKTIERFINIARPGDILYVRDGNYTNVQDKVYDAHVFIDDKSSGYDGRPISIVGFPREKPIVGSSEHAYGIFMFKNLENWTIANLEIRGKRAALAMSPLGIKRNIRLVANKAQGIIGRNGVFQLDSTENLNVLGNELHDSGIPGDKFSHLLYYGGFGPGSKVNLSWNRLYNQTGGRCLQVFGHHDDDYLTELKITNNILFNCRLDGILVGGSDAKNNRDWIADALIEKNIVSNTGGAGIRIDNAGVKAVIRKNDIRETKNALMIQRAKEAVIQDNYLLGTGEGVIINAANHYTISGNTYLKHATVAAEKNAQFLDKLSPEFIPKKINSSCD